MMHQPIDPFDSDDRPVRDTVIDHDEIVSLKIDLEILTPEEIYKKYFEIEEE